MKTLFILLTTLTLTFVKGAVLSTEDLSWNSIFGVPIFPSNVDSRIDGMKDAAGNGPEEHVITELKSLLGKPGLLDRVYRNYLTLLNKTETPVKGNSSLSRVQIFKDKLIKIAAHNMEARSGIHSWTMGVNHFTDKTASELKLPLWSISGPTTTFAELDAIYGYSKLLEGAPDELDYRSQGIVSPIKNQLSGCINGGGACYAFTAAGSVESAHARRTGKILDLSEKEIVDCYSPGKDGCDGGDLYEAISYMKGGVALEDEYPYVGTHAPSGACESAGKSRNAPVDDVVQILYSNEANLQALLIANGPVAVAVAADSIAWSSYRGGLYRGICAPEPNHGVIIVGYTRDAWILKNSWDTFWGDEGFMYLERGDTAARCKLYDYFVPILSMA